MEATREIYWNIGDGALVLVPMYLMALFSVAIIVYGAEKRIRIYRQGRPLVRWDQPARRFFKTARRVLFQTRIIRASTPGRAHGLFFWCFMLLFAGTILILVQADLTKPLMGTRFLTGDVYRAFSLILDAAGLVCIAMLAAMAIRQFVAKPKGLATDGGHVLMHLVLFLILGTGFMVEGLRMAATELGTPLAAWSPVGMMVAKGFSGLPLGSLHRLHALSWWGHLALVTLFLAALPFTRLRHLITTTANTFMSDLGPTGKLATTDLSDEKAKNFGADAIWSCTTCLACQEFCPAQIEHVNKIVEIRRNRVLMQGEFPGDEVMAAMEQTEVNGNPLGMGFAARGDWADDLPVVRLDESEGEARASKVDILYFVGCYASFDRRNIAVARSFIALCHAAGVRVGILGKKEKCCGEPMRKMGNEYLYQGLAQENIEAMKAWCPQKVVTTCPHCFQTLSKEYRDFGFCLPVEHHTVFLQELLRTHRLPIDPVPFGCTYHDSCYLGRCNGIFDSPRALIEAAGGRIKEMRRNNSDSFCCGAGGGRILAQERIGDRINEKRVDMARHTRQSIVVSNCPFCLTMFEGGIKNLELDGQLIPRDIAEILETRINPKKPTITERL